MGCDIHMSIEVRKDGRWTNIDKSFPWETSAYEGNGANIGIINYDLFSTLAGVRRREEFPPIDYPRGIPVDADVATVDEPDDFPDRLAFTGCWSGEHSHSWYTLRELIDNRKRFQDAGGNHFLRMVDQLQEIAAPDDARIVFSFDS
jgi:hypothetical protein